ncbi:MAG TPA: prolipoprotein diacylglyceryl transferase [Desulfotomaculum sp.]|nr:prolipoprotein diacylglyceryl transferase [Desulfotomaculum sp.]
MRGGIAVWPVLFHIGDYAVHSYGVMLAVAVMAGVLAGEREAGRRGIDPDYVFNLAAILVISGIIGSRIAYVLIEWPRFAGEPGAVLRIWDGGLSYYGALIAGLPLLWLYGRAKGVRFGEAADIAALGLAAGYPLARIGCFLNGCCYGKPADLPWAVAFPFDGVPRHPTQLYAVAIGIVIFLALRHLSKQKRFPGELAYLYLIFYGTYRFGIEFLRVSPPAGAYLTLGQVFSLAVVCLAVTLLILRVRALQKQPFDR